MNFTLKNVKYSATFSEETNCYKATLYLDGKKIGTVQNEGHGGSDYVQYDDPAVRERVSAYVKALPPLQPSAEYIRMGIKDPLPMSESLFFGLMVEEFLKVKEQARVDALNAKRQAKMDAKVIESAKLAKATAYRITYTNKADTGDVRMAWTWARTAEQFQAGVDAALKKLGGAQNWIVSTVTLGS